MRSQISGFNLRSTSRASSCELLDTNVRRLGLTIALVMVGTDKVFMAADSRSSNAISKETLRDGEKKLFHLDGPVIAAAAGFGSSLTRDLIPMIIAVMKAKASAGDLEFIDDWLNRLGQPIYDLGRTLLDALGGSDPQLIVAFGCVTVDGPRVRIKRFDGGKSEVLHPGQFAAFGSDTDAMKIRASRSPTVLQSGR
jgi:hypothetical protein